MPIFSPQKSQQSGLPRPRSRSVTALGAVAAAAASAIGGLGTDAAIAIPSNPWTITDLGQGRAIVAGARVGRPGAITLRGLMNAWGPPNRVKGPRGGGNTCVAYWTSPNVIVELATYGVAPPPRGSCAPSVGKISRIITRGANWTTARGLRVGDTHDQLRRLYPEARLSGVLAETVGVWWLTPYETTCLGDCGGSTTGTATTVVAESVYDTASDNPPPTRILRFRVLIYAQGE